MKKLLFLLLIIFTTDLFASGIGNVASAPCDNATLSKYTGTVNAEINWEPNTIGLKWFNGDQQIAGQTSCTYNGTITVPPAPTKPGYTFNGWKVQKVTPPDGYTQLEYLESTGTQYIDTGVKLTSDDVIYEWNAKDNPNATSNKTTLFGSQAVGSNGIVWSGSLYGDNTNRLAYIGSAPSRVTGYVSSDNNFHSWTFVINSNHTAYLTKDGSQLPTFSWTGSLHKAHSLFMFGNSGAGIFFEASSVAFKYFKITDNGNVVFNGLPARRNSDNVLGIFDTVSGTFKTNLGTGTFIAGPVVQ